MIDLLIKAGFCIASIAVGVALYKLGNFLWGKPNRGGKRLVLFVLGLGMLTFFGLMIHYIEWKSAKEIFLFCLGIAIGILGLWLVCISCFSKPKDLDKQFDDVTNSLF